ncbi:MAG: MBL fold metallo-hydrolase [bacterium]|nr:MBL fold metallo-hydrolase [bacterium]
MINIELVCLGVGKGASYIMKGIPSTAFVIRVDGTPRLLVDAGAGIALSCLKKLNTIPNKIYISHNHTDHTGDLPVMIGALFGTNGKPSIFGHNDVLDIVKTYRMHDPMVNVYEVANWITQDDDYTIKVDDDFLLRLFKTKHSYLCYGFTLYYRNENILGYSADSPFDDELFRIVTESPIAIIDARDVATYDHPSFRDVEEFANTVPNCNIWLVHYEQTDFVPSQPNVKLLVEGQILNLKG